MGAFLRPLGVWILEGRVKSRDNFLFEMRVPSQKGPFVPTHLHRVLLYARSAFTVRALDEIESLPPFADYGAPIPPGLQLSFGLRERQTV